MDITLSWRRPLTSGPLYIKIIPANDLRGKVKFLTGSIVCEQGRKLLPNRCDSGTDGKVRMKEDVTRLLMFLRFSPEPFVFGVFLCLCAAFGLLQNF